MSTLIELDDVWVRYRMARDYALRGISLKIREGDVVGIIGPTGAGKSTLAKVMCGIVPNLEPCDEFRGYVSVCGLDTREVPVGIICRRCAMVFQDYEAQLFRTSVELEVAFGPENLGLEPSEIERRVKWALELTGLVGLERRYTYALSGGQKQRLAIASVLSLQPDVLVLDEATSDLDPRGKLELFQVIKKLIEARIIKAAVIIDHHLDKLAQLANRIVVLKNGEVIDEGTPREVLTKVELLKSLKLEPPQVTELFHRLGHTRDKLPLTIDEALEHTKNLRARKPERTEVSKVDKVLSLRDIWFYYVPSEWVLKGINLDVYRGECLGIIGQNGSGKTTLANIIMGILKPIKGRVTLLDQDVTEKGPTARIGIIGYVLQNPDYQIFNRTVYEELAFAPKHMNLPPDEVDRRVKHVAKLVGIEHLLDEDPFFLSKADRQRVAVASVLTMYPKILLLDEPTTGLTPGETRDLMDLVMKLNRELGMTVIVITHDMNVVARYCTRVVLMKSGEIVIDTDTRTLFKNIELLRQNYIEPPQIIEYTVRALGEPYLTVDELIQHLER
ncbi:MAG: ABC transporter ATP-binding protein [Thermoprotei archaeon]|nr:MAG: ABC transporter ATP-binding protein [Thermoprotei archaeon]